MRDVDANETVGVTRGCVTVDDTIVRSYDCVGHSSSCYTCLIFSTMMDGAC